MPQELPQVRLALPQDAEDVMAMCRRLHAENGLFTLNEDKVRECLRKHYEREGGIIGVIGEPGRLEASTCLALASFYYTDDTHLEEHWNFVDEAYRKSRNAEALVEFGKACAVKMNMPLFTGIITNKRMAGKVRLFIRLLGAPVGAYFMHNAPWKSEPMTDDHTDLRNRLKELGRICNDSPRKVTFDVAQKRIGPLVREAADAILSEDNIWRASQSNGSAHG